ncbi:MAG: MFS transporter [Chloroflexi bacterium]|nr:MFS transporter [Chloroflexota bacterium]
MHTPPAHPAAAPAADPRYKWKAFIAIAIAFVTQVTSMSMVFVALSSIADDYGVTLRAVAWVVVAQALTISALMMPMGRLADIIGWKRVHLGGLALFGSGALLTAVAPTFAVLILARVVMATGAAMGQSVGTAMVVAVFPPAERGTAIGSQTTAVSIGGASGPILGGLVLQVLPWEALFWLLIPPCAIAFVAGYRVLDDRRVNQPRSAPRPPFDVAGAALSAAAIALLVATINNPLALSWTSPAMLGSAAVSIALVAAFIRCESRHRAPMIDLRMFADRALSASVVTRFLGFLGSTITLLLMPIYLISARGLEEAAAGSILFLGSLGMGIAAQASGRLSDRFGPRHFALAGFAVMVGTALSLASLTSSTPFPVIMVALFVNGLAQGMWNVPNNTMIMSAIAPDRLGVVGALSNLTRNVGNVVGQAVASGVVVTVMAARGFDVPLSRIATIPGAADAFMGGWRLAYLLASAFVGLALTLTLVTPRPATRPLDRPEPERASARG